MIGTGTQVMHGSYISTYAEDFATESRSKLYQTLKQNEVSNVFLITGDVHMAQAYENDCKSLTGINRFVEYTSSGLSHTQYSFMM